VSAVQFFAREPHFVDHLAPIAEALGDRVAVSWHNRPDTLAPGVLTVVAAIRDCRSATQARCPIVMSEHGCGLRYEGDHPSYAGGPGREAVRLFISVNEMVDAANRASYPHAQHAIVGSPRVDALVARQRPIRDPDALPVVAFSWHWECRVVPETRSAFPHYRRTLNQIAKRHAAEWTPLGHAHPRAWAMVRAAYRGWKWPVAPTFDQVVDEADVYVCDNSSTIYEWAALDRPVVVVNAPMYRKNVIHGDGLRFWDNIPGEQVNRGNELSQAIERAITLDPMRDERRRIADLVYPHRGEAAERAAAAILQAL